MITKKLIEIPIDTVIHVNNKPVKIVRYISGERCFNCIFKNYPGSCERLVCESEERTDRERIYFENVVLSNEAKKGGEK